MRLEPEKVKNALSVIPASALGSTFFDDNKRKREREEAIRREKVEK